jgi:hypothetical protein
MNETAYIATRWSGIPAARTPNDAFSMLRRKPVIVMMPKLQRSLDFKSKIKTSYSKFPIISFLLHFLSLSSLLGLGAYIFFGIQYITHPYAIIWLFVASAGLSSVVWTAAGEFDGAEI